jgi:hypothetical protein
MCTVEQGAGVREKEPSQTWKMQRMTSVCLETGMNMHEKGGGSPQHLLCSREHEARGGVN